MCLNLKGNHLPGAKLTMGQTKAGLPLSVIKDDVLINSCLKRAAEEYVAHKANASHLADWHF